MGQEISFSEFEQGDFDRFYQKLRQETSLLRHLIEHRRFSKRTPVAGFEIEAWILDNNCRPLPINESFLATLNHPLAFEELAKFNIELNSTPTPLAGNVFSRMHSQLQETWDTAYRHAESLNGRLIMIGILPTLVQDDLTLANMSNLNRYRALNQQILQSRGKPVHLDITGHEHLKLDHHDVMLESATTSFQIHIQVPLGLAHHFYNASIIASAAMVASCANAPYLFGKDLWNETRIPLFEQAIETGGYAGVAQGPLRRVSFGTDYARKSIMECFEENLQHFPILLPEAIDSSPEAFAHLKLHNGTIWRWNRPLLGFDADGTPHIRIEHRTPAAGPTPLDSIANAAFFYGLSKNLCDEIITQGLPFPFSQAKDNFYQAARYGLDASIHWLNGKKIRMHTLLREDLIERAALGLASLGISRCDSEDYLDIMRQRLNNQQTGSQWQRQFIKEQGKNFKLMTETYLNNQQSATPVGEWSTH
ncbi:glutamate--cysteine ligase [Methylomarinum sp. Ch1-1]|uniref:Glutamate--cysteine ligase n=1 Tax=Methylomarinum roseum TaxID=3067653 RepID=A0AAU7NR14_9GAMM|nr:glutamate--cysteine ligase [Methylomarinum sp. Ch1-1]MDP4520945.1 glutamate--cysteine ligase [Methylomarinum sp. Ch1-1]